MKQLSDSRPEADSILTQEAIEFISDLQKIFNGRRLQLLSMRLTRQRDLDNGNMFDFLEDTSVIRKDEWKVATVPDDLRDRRVEITGPADDRKMVINALNSGAYTFMADFEDSCSPTWHNIIQGQINLRDAVNGKIDYIDPVSEKQYSLNDNTATLIVRPRGWHLEDRHLLVDGVPVSASLLDFGLYLFHNAHSLLSGNTGPYFYLPKLENHLEARLWNDVFISAQDTLGIPRGTIKATVLIETLPAALEMDEILYELREHSSGLNCGRWDYIFSFIKKLRNKPEFILPDRSEVTMLRHFLKSYVELLIQTCHRRGAHAMGGMAAQIPIKTDTQANDIAMNKVLEDKFREVKAGHDGTWVAHPGLVSVAMKAFSRIQGPEQIGIHRKYTGIDACDLLEVPEGSITETGFINNISVGIQYLEAWIRGRGAVPLYHLMEDTATAEICRAQLWQWLHHNAALATGKVIDESFFTSKLDETIDRIRAKTGQTRFESGEYIIAAELFSTMVRKDNFDEFLTIPAYNLLEQEH